ncbi:putative RING-H2 finger protein ATL71 [Syzygium oleosum]|uniref:putative RING-H2 finger protein ATL71 n=1 Tax=Syzygium oleosum TaxID=219896 RepID=UPI0011D2984E|nr:putative RING-H2 finger protein ATL71 [Syzygium oleosum]
MDGTADSGHGRGVAIGILVVVIFVAVVAYIISRMRANLDDQPSPNPARDSSPEQRPETILEVEGDQEDTVSKRNGPDKLVRPKLAEDRKGDSGSGSDSTRSSCSICLRNYKDSDVLRLLPECHHVFHRKCVDQWLQMHPTCPVCRSSPIPTPLAKAALPSTAPRDRLDW